MRVFNQLAVFILVQFVFVAPVWAHARVHVSGHEHSMLERVGHFFTYLLNSTSTMGGSNPMVLAIGILLAVAIIVSYRSGPGLRSRFLKERIKTLPATDGPADH